MAENQNGTKSLVKTEERPDLGIQEFGKREDIAALGARIRAMMPGGEKLTNQQAMAAAQYALTLGANPFRGEIYAYEDRGQLQIVEGYKLLVRWAKAKCDYSEWYMPLENLDEGDIGFTCYILRKDKHELLQTFLDRGMELDRAMDIVTVSAGGVVRADEMIYSRDSKWHKRGDPLGPPTGWTWEDVAKKRALKNALNKSHGVPSLADIARESWNVHGIETQPEDWQDVHAGMLPAEAEATAEYNAKLRQMHEREPTVANAAEAVDDLFGDGAGDEFAEGEYEEIEPPSEQVDNEPDTEPAANGDRPYSPETIKAKLTPIAEAGSGAPLTQQQRGLLAGKLEECFAGEPDADKKRHSVTRYLFGFESLDDAKQGHADAILKWILHDGQKDDTGDYPLHEHAPAEAAGIVKGALEDAGQQSLF